MNKQELDNALAFINSPSGELQIIIYANVIGTNEPRKLNINEEDLIGLRQLFVSSLEDFIISKEDYTLLPLSTADERGNCFYEYDLELPDELQRLETTIGNDDLRCFDLSESKFEDIESLIIVIADSENEISLFKKMKSS